MQHSSSLFFPALDFTLHTILQRSICTGRSKKWGVKQVTRSNIGPAVERLKEHIQDADFIAVSLQSTGSHGASWRRILPVDTSETAYYKAKDSAETFQLLHFAVCPFKWSDSKFIAFPYNFHLFPHDKMGIGVPSYSFLCQLSSISSMAQKGFDFNCCIYDGISYLPRALEASVMQWGGISSMLGTYPALSYQKKSTSDMIFMEKIKSEVQHWRDACLNSSGLVYSFEAMILNNEMFGTRPCLRIDAASGHQVQLILEVLREFPNDLVPLTNSVGVDTDKEVKVVFTNSEEDKHLLLSQLQQQDDQKKQVSQIRDIVDAIINSGKIIVGYNCLSDLTIIYSNFIEPLPPTSKEFLYSLHSIFPQFVDVSHLLKVVCVKGIPRMKKAKDLQAALSYLNRHFFLPMNLEVPLEFKCYGYRGSASDGYTVLRLISLFTKVCHLLKISSSDFLSNGYTTALASYANILYPSGTFLNKRNHGGEVFKLDEDSDSSKTSKIVFIWGFKIGSSAKNLLEMLGNIHEVCQKGIEVGLIDESCAYIRFKRSKYADIFIQDVQSGANISGFAKSKPLEEITSGGLRAVTYTVYERLCKSSLWKHKLADSFELVMPESESYFTRNFTLDLPSSKGSELILELGDL